MPILTQSRLTFISQIIQGIQDSLKSGRLSNSGRLLPQKTTHLVNLVSEVVPTKKYVNYNSNSCFRNLTQESVLPESSAIQSLFPVVLKHSPSVSLEIAQKIINFFCSYCSKSQYFTLSSTETLSKCTYLPQIALLTCWVKQENVHICRTTG